MHMHRPSALGNGLKRLVSAPRGCRGLATVTETDVESARRYCLKQLQTSDYDAHLIRRFMPPPVQDTYAALRALNLELVRLPEMVSNPTIGAMRVKFWHDAIDRTFAGQPPREPICILLHKALRELEQRTGGVSTSTKSIKFWVSRLIRTRERHMDNRPFATLDSLEDYAENTYSTIMYATLASMPLRSMHVDHLASHIGKACGIVAVLRGVPVLAAPPQPVRSPSGLETPSRSQALLLPLDVMAEEGVKEEEVFRQGPGAPGLQDAIFKVATRANDHLITAREMLKRLKAGQDPGHEFEHQGEGEHHYVDEESDVARDVRRGFGVLLEAVPAAQWLLSLEKANFDPFAVRAGGWRLPWGIWQALSKERI
ncbi:squalene/phytoene synthase [Trichoderma longibrachiatum]